MVNEFTSNASDAKQSPSKSVTLFCFPVWGIFIRANLRRSSEQERMWRNEEGSESYSLSHCIERSALFSVETEREQDRRICTVSAVRCRFISGLMGSALNSHILDEWKDFPPGLMSSVSTPRSRGSAITLQRCVLRSAEQHIVKKKYLMDDIRGICEAFKKCFG